MSRTKPPAGWRVGDWGWDEIYRDLAALWLFNEGQGRIVSDASGNGFHGTIQTLGGSTGAQWVSGPSGWELRFQNNAAGRVELGVTGRRLLGEGHFSVAYRALVEPEVADWGSVIGIAGAGANLFYVTPHYIPSSRHLYLTMRNANDTASLGVTTPNANLGVRHTGAAGYNGRVMVSLNGAPWVLGASGARSMLDANIRLGSVSLSGSPLLGPVEWVAVWRRALSNAEVRRIHEQPPWLR